MEPNNEFDNWLLKKKEERKSVLLGAAVIMSLGIAAFGIGWPIIGTIIVGGTILGSYQSIKLPTENDFQAEKKAEEEENKRKARDKARAKKAKEKKAKEEAERVKQIESKFDVVEKNFNKLMAIDCPRPEEFKNNLSQYEKEISTKGSPEYLHKFVKISTFLDDLWSHLVDNRQAMRNEFDPKTFAQNYKRKKEQEENRSLEDITIELERKARGDFKDYSADGLLRQLIDVSEMAVKEFPKEFAQVTYLEAMANSMLIFLLEGKQIYFFQILESFDKLGALDSSWQKSVSNKMSSIESKLDLMISGISNLNDSINSLIEKNDDISKQLQSIDSGISTNNVLQAITAYQVYKINKNTKSLKS